MHLGNGLGVVRTLQADDGRGVIDCVNLGGSLFGFQRNVAVAAAAGLLCWHGSGNDLSIMGLFFVHAAAAALNCTMASDFVGSWTREDDLIAEPIEFVDGYVPLPMSPGLSCELDEEALQEYITAHEEIAER